MAALRDEGPEWYTHRDFRRSIVESLHVELVVVWCDIFDMDGIPKVNLR